MKILQINAVYGIGSTGHITQDIHNTLIQNGYDSYVLWGTAASEDAKSDSHIKQIGGIIDHKSHAVLRRLFFDQGFHSLLPTYFACRQIERWGIDIVTLHNLHGNFLNLPYFLRFCAKHNIAVVVMLHDCWLFTGGCFHFYAYKNCQQWKGSCADCPMAEGAFRKRRIRNMYKQKTELFGAVDDLYIIGVTEWITGCAKQSLLACTPNHLTIHNWIDIDLFKPRESIENIREKYGIPKTHKLILGVSQIWNNEKGLDTFLAMGKAVKDFATIVMVGGNPGIGEAEGIKFIGYTANRQELVDLYSAANITVNASHMETGSLITVESMACGTPVVAYNNTGTTELVPPECGWLVNDGNIEEMVDTVITALKSDTAAMQDNCLKWVSEYFDRKKQISKYIELYREIDKKRRQQTLAKK